jgi:hypothetical protein
LKRLLKLKLMKTTTLLFGKILALQILIFIFPVAVSAQWSSPVDLSTGAVSAILNESMGSCIGVSNDTLHVVWADRKSSSKGVIYYTQSADTGLNWSTPIALTDTAGNAWNPAIAVNGSSIHLVWRVIDPLNNARRASWYKRSLDGGNTWGPDVFLDSTADWPGVAVSGNIVYVVNDVKTSDVPWNTEIFLLRSIDNGSNWSIPQQLTFALDRSEDEAIAALGSYIHMSWNDKRNGTMQFFYKESADYGVTWGPDVLLLSSTVYGPGICANGAYADATCSRSPNGPHPQVHLEQSADTGATWVPDKNLTNDTLNTYIYPYMVRDSNDLHVTFIKAGIGGQYLHSADGGTTWDTPFTFFSGNVGITPFPAYTGCALHIIFTNNTDHHVYYMRNPTGNAGHCSEITTEVSVLEKPYQISIFPNPFSTQTTLRISSSQKTENTELRIFDMMGTEVQNISGINSNEINIERGSLPSGIYFYQLKMSLGNISVGKLMVE